MRNAAIVGLCAAGLIWMSAGPADGGRRKKLPPFVLTPEQVAELPPPPARDIPVRFTLDRGGFVTLVVEGEDGNRVRNLLAETYLPAGEHTVMWDGYDVGEPVLGDRPYHGMHDMRRRRVAAGRYRLRGLVHDGIDLRYEMSVQSPGTPPWMTLDGDGAWLGDHTPQTACLFLPDGSDYGKAPQVMIACTTAEAGFGIIWVDQGGEKLGGMKFGWSGAQALAADRGPRRDPNAYAYSVRARKGQVHLDAHRFDGTHEPLHQHKGDSGGRTGGMALAVRDRTAVISMPPAGELVFLRVDADAPAKRREIAIVKMPGAKGLAVDAAGRLYVAAGDEVRVCDVDWAAGAVSNVRPFIADGLDAPHALRFGPGGNLYVTDWGDSHQVKVFDSAGRAVRTIGKPGGLCYGRYDPRRMCNPNAPAVDAKGQLWVPETTYFPKRTSLWQAGTGRFVRAYYGPPKYSAGGCLDPRDRTLFYYSGASGTLKLGIEFKLDWSARTAVPLSIYCHAEKFTRSDHVGRKTTAPELACYVEGRKFMVTHLGNAAWAPRTAVVWEWDEKTRTVEQIAMLGSIKFWPALREKPLADRIPEGATNRNCGYIWSDLNRDGRPQVDEVRFRILDSGAEGYKHIQHDLSMLDADGTYWPPPTLNDDGVPVWDISKVRTAARFRHGWSDAVGCRDGFLIKARGPIEGWRDGRRVWEYPAQYPNRARGPVPQHPGHLIKTARVCGPTVTPREGEAGEIWGLVGDMGNVYLLTSDGLFLAELGGDQRTTPPWAMPEAKRGMLIGDVSFKSEHWWATLNQIADTGEIIVQAGKEHSSLLTLTGLETVRRVEFGTVTVTAEQLAGKPDSMVKPAEWRVPRETAVPLLAAAPKTDGDLADWPDDRWLAVDAERGLFAALAVHGGTLHAAWRVGDPARLVNPGGQGWRELFATGGGLDIMLRPDPDASPPKHRGRFGRVRAAPGDVRLFVTRTGDPKAGPLRAVLYRQVGEGDSPHTFDSPVRRVDFAHVADVTDRITLAQRGGNYELAVPLKLLGVDLRDGLTTRGDVGVLLGAGGETAARLYWARGAGGMVSDVPTESSLRPDLWGTLTFGTPAGPEKTKDTGPTPLPPLHE